MNYDDISNSEIPATSELAEFQFKQWKVEDPFPYIPPALLNANDIYDYARVTGMIWPFAPKDKLEDKLKLASYEVDFLGDVHLVDNKGRHKVYTIEQDTPFLLTQNSIAYVHLKTEFRLPDYIALRFNLRITHVHRGLLLGTGPLVDPGFKGKLLIPLHNLTAKDYLLVGGEGLIWVEFTKVSPRPSPDDPGRKKLPAAVKFPSEKMNLSAQKYFNKASGGLPAKSSIPSVFESAKETAEKAERKVNTLFWSGIFGLLISVVALVGSTWNLISNASKSIYDSNKTVTELSKSVNEIKDGNLALLQRLNELEQKAKEQQLPPATQNKSEDGEKKKEKSSVAPHGNK